MKRESSTKLSSKSLASSDSTPSSSASNVTPFVRAFLKRAQNTVAKHQLWNQKESFIVAVSGGPDSLCLLDILYLLSQKYDFTLHIAHVNYRLRGKAADLDEALVRERAEHYGLSLSVLHPRKTDSSNLEERLRDIRYRFFERLRMRKRATLIALAHHQDDQAETFLLRLLRGAGMQGLSAMRPKSGVLVRPLIETSREDILRYLKERGLSYREDESNTDPCFLRNRLRHELIPLLEKKYQPQVKKLLVNTATLLAEDYATLEKLAPLLAWEKRDGIEFSAQSLLALPLALAKKELRTLLRPHFQKKSPPKGLIDEILKALRSTKNKHQTVSFRGLKIERKGDTVRLLNF